MAAILRGRRVGFPSRSRPSASTLFLQFPPIYRSFHASPRPQFVEQVIPVAYSIIDGLHSVTGLPWAFTLPLSAILIRVTCVLPLTIYARLTTIKQFQLLPLLSAWRPALQKQTMAEIEVMRRNQNITATRAHSILLKNTKNKRDEVYRRWGAQRWKTYLHFLHIPIWLTAMEAIREMCGQNNGIIGMLFRTKIDGVAQVLPLEETFATEGMLWFPDLMAADPQMLLPFILSGMMFLNITKMSRVPKLNRTRFQTGLDRSLKVVALAIGPLTLNVPSAMLIYWIASSGFALVQGIALELLMPLNMPKLGGAKP